MRRKVDDKTVWDYKPQGREQDYVAEIFLLTGKANGETEEV